MLAEEPNKGNVIEWEIKNFHMCPYQNGKCLQSPIINLSSLSNTKWYLELYPRGVNDGNENIGCYLHRDGDYNGPEDLKIDVVLSVNAAVVEWKNKRLKNIHEFGRSLLRRESISVYNDRLVITCRINVSGDCPAATKNKLSSANSNEKKERNVKLDNLSLESQKPFCHFLIYSKISTETRSFMCPIRDIKFEDKGQFVLRAIYVTDDDDSMLNATLYLMKSEDEVWLQTDICFEGDLEEEFAVICSIDMLDSDAEIRGSAKDKHVFVGKKEDIWHFSHPFKWSEVKKNDYLHFKFTISNGSMLTNVGCGTGDDNPNIAAPDAGFLKELFRFYTQKKFCDVTLFTGGKVFKCHKIVLSSLSPVFASMFESNTNTIQIDDLDPDTVVQMLLFMYTGTVEELEDKSATNLLTAAEKYQVNLLKSICIDFLKIKKKNETSDSEKNETSDSDSD